MYTIINITSSFQIFLINMSYTLAFLEGLHTYMLKALHAWEGLHVKTHNTC